MCDRYYKPADCQGMPLRPISGLRCTGPADAWERGRLSGQRARTYELVGLKPAKPEAALKAAAKGVQGLLEHADEWHEGWQQGWDQPVSKRRQRALADLAGEVR